MRRVLWTAMLSATLFACSDDDNSSTEPVDDDHNTGGTGGQNLDSGVNPMDQGAGGAENPADVQTCEPGGLLAKPIAPQPIAAYITSEELAPSFDAYAHLHMLFGTSTTVITTDQICNGQCNDEDPTNDTAKHIKQWLMGQPDIRYAILAGDIEHVPSRRVKDSYKNPFMQEYTFKADFYTDYYFADFSEWDKNGDGIYAQDGVDQPGYRPDIAVSRIPISTPEEADRYLNKLRRYFTQYNVDKVRETLLLTNVATEVLNAPIDGAWYFEAEGRTVDLMPDGSTIRKLYATGLKDGELNSLKKQIEAIEQGYNIIVHNGHGGVHSLTVEQSGKDDMTGDLAFGLKNSTYPIFLSCACEAATFSASDSAGEMFMNAAVGGGIAYLGNAAVGLGLAGGVQLIDELLRYIKQTPYPILGDALFVAHTNMPETDTFVTPGIPIAVPVVDKDSYEWTQKSATMFGDVLIPVWKGAVKKAPALKLNVGDTCEGMRIEVVSTPAVDGAVRIHVGVDYYEVMLKNGKGWLHVESAPAMEAGFILPGQLGVLATYP